MNVIWLFLLSLGLAVPPSPLAAYLPDPGKTPGDILPVTQADVCTPGYSKKVRDVPEAVKHQVYLAYGITRHQPGEFEVDHECSLELGGSNRLANLWPEPFHINVGGYEMGAHEKDKLEDRLHALVCSGRLTLSEAQSEVRGDWTVAYRRWVHPQFPLYVEGSHAPSVGARR